MISDYSFYTSANIAGNISSAGQETSRTVYGTYSSAVDAGSMNSNLAAKSTYGVYGTAQDSAASHTNNGASSVYGGYFQTTGTSSNVIGQAYGVQGFASGADTNYGVYAVTTAAAGLTGYALYADAGTGAGTEYAGIFMNGNVGIGTTGPVAKMDVAGTVRVGTLNSGTYSANANVSTTNLITTNTSDVRFKKNITTIENALDKVLHLRGVTFNWNDENAPKRMTGMIAQEVLLVMPELVFKNPTDGYYGLFYGETSGLLIEAIKEQQEQLTALQEKVASQQLQIEELKKEIEELKKI